VALLLSDLTLGRRCRALVRVRAILAPIMSLSLAEYEYWLHISVNFSMLTETLECPARGNSEAWCRNSVLKDRVASSVVRRGPRQ